MRLQRPVQPAAVGLQDPTAASSPWSTPSTPARLCAPSSTASPSLVSAKALETRVTSSIPPPVASSSRESLLDSGSLQVPPFSNSGFITFILTLYSSFGIKT